jgi:glycosyltransferase involved in cell wall biosynthesis
MLAAERPERAADADARLGLRIAVYTDYAYRREDGAVYADRAFALFLNELAERVGSVTVLGRVDPRDGHGPYRLDGVEFVELPFYEALTSPLSSGVKMAASLRRFWRGLDGVDAVWLLGPHPLALAFAGLARARGRRVVLGVRQNMGVYLRSRHPHRRWLWAAGAVLEGAWRLVGRRAPVVVVGPELADQYRRSRDLLPVAISLIRADQIEDGPARVLDGDVRVLSVGRLETEKNPLMLSDVLARLDDRWQLAVAGEGPLLEPLGERMREQGVADRAELLGYLPFDGGLFERYRSSDVLLHVSWTEGLPQILFEAFAAGLPVVATDVGGIRAAVGEACELIAPGDPDAAAAALRRVVEDPARRQQLIEAGRRLARAHTVEAETGRVARFIAGGTP